MFLLYSIALGLMRAVFSAHSDPKTKFKVIDPKEPVFDDHWQRMMDFLWVDLAGMLVFLIAAIMGAVLVSIFTLFGYHRGCRPGTI